MFRLVILSTTIIVAAALYAPGAANAAAYCAQLRSAGAAKPECAFATLQECRASVKAKGGGHCYKLH